MEDDKFTEEDWDYVMKKYPKLKKQYDEMLFFNSVNPTLAKEIDKECIKRINNHGKESKVNKRGNK